MAPGAHGGKIPTSVGQNLMTRPERGRDSNGADPQSR